MINRFYNGGTSNIGTSGTNFGVEFTSDALLLCLNTSGTNCSNTSRGGEGIASSAFGALFFPGGNPTINVAAGFTDGFAFACGDPFAVGTTVNIFSGLNGTGTLLATAVLPGTGNMACDAAIAANANYCPFNPYSIAFSGTASSFVFAGTPNRQVFDDFTFGSVVVGGAVPEPATWGMMILGFGVVGGAMRYRQRSTRIAFG